MNFNLLRPVVFAELKVGDKVCNLSGSNLTVKYKTPIFAVIEFNDGSEGSRSARALEASYKIPPLCWVEEKPVYPGDVLYYKNNPAWKYNEEGVIATLVGGNNIIFKDNQVLPIDTATWTKPEPKRVPSFQVEDVDVYPGDTVYYYGINKNEWGATLTVKENGYVICQRTRSVANVNLFEDGTKSFRLKPMLVIDDRLVPMPEREAPAVGTIYYSPHIISPGFYSSYEWSGCQVDNRRLKRGLVHLNKEAAIAHGEALVKLSKKKD